MVVVVVVGWWSGGGRVVGGGYFGSCGSVVWFRELSPSLIVDVSPMNSCWLIIDERVPAVALILHVHFVNLTSQTYTAVISLITIRQTLHDLVIITALFRQTKQTLSRLLPLTQAGL